MSMPSVMAPIISEESNPVAARSGSDAIDSSMSPMSNSMSLVVVVLSITHRFRPRTTSVPATRYSVLVSTGPPKGRSRWSATDQALPTDSLSVGNDGPKSVSGPRPPPGIAEPPNGSPPRRPAGISSSP